MPANNTNSIVYYWAGKYPEKIGWIINPPYSRTKLRPWLPFAIDNGAFSAFKNKSDWNLGLWMEGIAKIKKSGFEPLWALVPDVVADRAGTLAKWHQHKSIIAEYGWNKAFAVQDGMVPEDVPTDADVVFVGGTYKWKWRTIATWAKHFPRVHVGRVYASRRLWQCHDLGVESVDGTGWFLKTEDGENAQILKDFIEGNRPKETMELQFA